jgi:hypothetical protein
MLVARVYGVSFILVAGAIGILYVTDSFTFGTSMVLGFIASVLAGAGLLVVYPALMTERVSLERKTPKETKQKYSSAGVFQGGR